MPKLKKGARIEQEGARKITSGNFSANRSSDPRESDCGDIEHSDQQTNETDWSGCLDGLV